MGNGLTKSESEDLKSTLKRLQAVNRVGYLSAYERFSLADAITAIEARLSPKPVSALVGTAAGILATLEPTMIEIDERNEAAAREGAEAVLG